MTAYPYHELVRDCNDALTRSRRRYGNTRLPVIRIGDCIVAIAYVLENHAKPVGYGFNLEQPEYLRWSITPKQLVNLYIQAQRLYNMTDEQFNRIYPQERS